MQHLEDYFVCIGAQKAGTTWLLRILSEHPDIFVTPVKEVRYFDNADKIANRLTGYKRRSRFLKHMLRSLTMRGDFGRNLRDAQWYRLYLRSPVNDEWYCNLFSERGGAHLAGEATPGYATIGKAGFEHIRRLAPDAKIVYVLRNPIEQAWSQYLHFHPDITSRSEIDLERVTEFWNSHYSRKFRQYADTIDDVRAVFPSENVLIFFYEDLKSTPDETMNRLHRFLGVAERTYDRRVFTQRMNASNVVEMPTGLIEYFEPERQRSLTAVVERVGSVPDRWK